MNKAYSSRINWQNEPSIMTPLNAINLNKIDNAIYEIDNRVVNFDTSKANQSDLLSCIKSITYDTTSGIFTFTWQNGNTLKVDLNIEKIPVSFSMSESGVITMKNTDGSTYTADVGELIKTYSFNDSSTVNFTVTTDADGNKTITADIVDGSITDNKLQANYLADITTQANNASVSATASANSANLSANKAIEAESWAIGGTGTREGENTNNAKYWSEQAKATSHQQSDWNTEDEASSAFINNKPFKTIGEHLSVDENGALNAEGGGGTPVTVDSELSTTSENPVQNKVITQALNEKSNLISDAWNASTTYAVGQYCIYNNSLWKCLVQHNGKTPTEGTYWTKVNVANEITSVNNSIGDISGFTNDTYDSIGAYIQYCVYNGYLPDINSMPLIPTMTSNTAPSGVASASSIYSSNHDAYKAFDNDISTWWDANGGVGNWLQYKFTKKVCVKKLIATDNNGTTHMGVFKLQGSNDGSSFTDIATIDAKDSGSVTKNIANTNYYQYYRVISVSDTSGFTLTSLQLYGITQ